jgi:hypothetical protein
MRAVQGLLEWGLPGIPMHLGPRPGLCAATTTATIEP